MRLSQYLCLERARPSLDFVDVEVLEDTKLFIDPRATRSLEITWADHCLALVQGYFISVLKSIKEGDNGRALLLLRSLRQPNDIHLGLSRGRSRGRAMGGRLGERT